MKAPKAKVTRMRSPMQQADGYWLADNDAKVIVDAIDRLTVAVQEAVAAIKAK
jgi:hypothetical protein